MKMSTLSELSFLILSLISLTILSAADSFSEKGADQNQGKSNDTVDA
jgi:hypothetical protein